MRRRQKEVEVGGDNSSSRGGRGRRGLGWLQATTAVDKLTEAEGGGNGATTTGAEAEEGGDGVDNCNRRGRGGSAEGGGDGGDNSSMGGVPSSTLCNHFVSNDLI